MIPEYTKIVNVVGDESQNYWGPGPLQDSWTKEELDNKSAAKGLVKKRVNWYIYKNTGDLVYSQFTGQPLNPLGDEDLLFNMTCYNGVSVDSPDGNLYTQALNLTSSTVITPYGDWTWDTLKGKAHFYCPEGKCVNDECLGVPVPTWNETLYDAQHANETTGRNGDNIRS
ncbi:uncharacterized protein L199_006996 [Kwoniella botswanensis]|uniref:uncharacterized protein n=1 Tax=Kwoniella botswanensis TaxID=1268659 RepID=UPI00315D9FD9